MAASTPRKSAPRKSPPRKAPTPKAAPKPDPVLERIARFDELRARAGHASAGLSAVVSTHYELGAEWGFDPPVVASFPTDLEAKVELEIASRRGDTIGILAYLLGDLGLVRVIRAFKSQPDGERLLYGLQLRLQDHFLGRGAGDVPGGTPASSTS
ncbi:hypothetical protein [Nocardia brasiliensis]|uniref:hypothetical protein n=1 Tax=Nocardia brasiliensis TaxID=37326 RepID=UPI002454D13B|nr:hypothetical protein [Nocardia brasiliensis]